MTMFAILKVLKGHEPTRVRKTKLHKKSVGCINVLSMKYKPFNIIKTASNVLSLNTASAIFDAFADYVHSILVFKNLISVLGNHTENDMKQLEYTVAEHIL